MAKKKKIVVRLVSSANTGHFYTKIIGKKREVGLKLSKYDPKVKKHVLYVEKKIK